MLWWRKRILLLLNVWDSSWLLWAVIFFRWVNYSKNKAYLNLNFNNNLFAYFWSCLIFFVPLKEDEFATAGSSSSCLCLTESCISLRKSQLRFSYSYLDLLASMFSLVVTVAHINQNNPLAEVLKGIQNCLHIEDIISKGIQHQVWYFKELLLTLI